MHFLIDSAVVDFLIHSERVGPGLTEPPVVSLVKGKDLQGNGGEVRLQRGNRVQQVGHRRFLRGFAGEDENVPDACCGDGRCLLLYLSDAQFRAGEVDSGMEAAVGAGIGAVIRDVQRCVEADHPAEVLQGELPRPSGHAFKNIRGKGGCEQVEQVVEVQLLTL